MEVVAGTAAVEHSKVAAGPIVVDPLVAAHIAAVVADPTVVDLLVAAHIAAVVDLVAIVDCPCHSYFLNTNSYN